MRKLRDKFLIPVFMDMMQCRLIHKVDQEILSVLLREVISSSKVFASARFVSLHVVPFQSICVKTERHCNYTRRAS